MISSKSSIFLLIIFFHCSCNNSKEANRELTLPEIIDKNTKALGETSSIDSIQNIKIISTLRDRKYVDSVEFMADRKGRMRIDIFNGDDRVYTESYDGKSGYQWSPKNGQSPASEKGTIALSHTPQLPGHIFQIKDLNKNGHDLKLVDKEVIGDNEYYVLKLILDDGFEVFYYVDSKTYLITKSRSKRALHVDVDSTEQFIEVRFEDYRMVNGVNKPFKTYEIDLNTDSVLMENTVHQFIMNRILHDSTYVDLNQSY